LILLITFLDKNSEMHYCLEEGITQSFLIRQFVLSDLFNKDFNIDCPFEEIVDQTTLSEPKISPYSITRSQQILKFVNKVNLI